MRAIRLRTPGGLDKLEPAELPEPSSPGPGEIQVRIRASSLNYHDYVVVSGAGKFADGLVPMSDGAGEVSAVGEGVSPDDDIRNVSSVLTIESGKHSGKISLGI
jgi:NADPH:quinone reductase-like Zn-dependent oxidoreductase